MANVEEIHKDIVYNAREQAKNCAIMVLEHVDDSALKESYLKKLESVLVACVKSEYDHSITKEAIRATKQTMQQDDVDAQISTHFDKVYKSHFKNLSDTKNLQKQLAKDPDLKNFRSQLQQVSPQEEDEEEDDELIATESTINLIDPISKKQMTDPVRNKHCGHIYDRDSVRQMIVATKRKGFKCPAMGCAHRQPIKESDLEEALDIKREIMKQKKQ